MHLFDNPIIHFPLNDLLLLLLLCITCFNLNFIAKPLSKVRTVHPHQKLGSQRQAVLIWRLNVAQ